MIEDNFFSADLALMVLGECPDFEVDVFESPREFLMKGADYDIIISDWNFGHVTLAFFINEIDKDKLIILTGSLLVFDVECIAILSKLDTKNLVSVINGAIKRTRFS